MVGIDFSRSFIVIEKRANERDIRSAGFLSIIQHFGVEVSV